MKLSEFELEVMQMFWAETDISAPSVHRLIEKNKAVTYSTVKTIIDRLEKKGALKRVGQTGRTIFYAAAVPPDTVKRPLVSSFIKRVFAGETRPLFSHILNQEKISSEDIQYLEALLAEKKKQLEN